MPAHGLPSPTSTSSLSPRTPSSHNMNRDHSCSDDESDQTARSALEIRREKNRIKQRNLRLRRANQMADLERTVQTMRNSSHDLEERLAAIESREASLVRWVRDLEAVLVASGQRDQVDSLRRVWAPSTGATSEKHTNRADPLATLATAASSFPRPHWEDDASARKRRREDDYQQGSRLPSPSRMRIDQLVLPLPRPSSQSPTGMMQSESWAWSQLPSIDAAHGYHQYKTRPEGFEQKPRVASQDSRAISPADRRPLSASSTSTGRTWSSPVQTFDVRI